MPSNSNTAINFICQPDTLQGCLQELGCSPTLSVDLEFDNNNHGYGVVLCLVQVATTQACYVIDPFADLDLSGLYTLFESTGIQKIVHAPGEDLRLLHSLGCYPQNLFDTEVPARLLNYEQTSLTVLLREKLGVHLDKKQQRSNWLRRPLSEVQVQYAAEDVRWLQSLKAVLDAEAAERSLMPFIQEEQDQLGVTRYPVTAKTSFLKPADLYALSPREQYITNEMLRYRDELARSMNRPAYQVMNEEALKELATGALTPASFVDSTGVHPRFRNSGFAHQLARRLEVARKEALHLSTDKQYPPKRTPAQYAAMQKAADDREKLFVPIQQALEQRFGPHAAKFLLSNRVVNELLNGSITLPDIKPAYRQALIRNIAAAGGIALDDYDYKETKESD